MMSGDPGNTQHDTTCAPCLWEQVESLSGAARLIARWLRGELNEHPGHSDPPAPETGVISDSLLTLAACGVLTVNSQPGMRDETHAQRAFLELIAPRPMAIYISNQIRSHHIRHHHWNTLLTRPARPPHNVDMVVTATRRTTPPDYNDPYVRAWLNTYLDTEPVTHYPAGVNPNDGDPRHADMHGLDPREWERCTIARSGWTIGDVFAGLRLDPPYPDGYVRATPDLVAALTGSTSMTIVDTEWGAPDRIITAVAEAATSWHVLRSSQP